MQLLRVRSSCLRLFYCDIRSYAKMDAYRFLEPEKEEALLKMKREKKKRRLTVTPAGPKEHMENPIPPRLRGMESTEMEVPLEHQKSLSIALLGPPNVGKSTLLNKLLHDHIAATSSKAQTTRTPIVGFKTIENTQLVFLDTPGIISRDKQKEIAHSLVVGSWATLSEADLVVVMADASKGFDRAYYPNLFHVLDTLKEEMALRKVNLETALFLNKIDKISPPKQRNEKIDMITATMVKEFPFLRRVFPLSVRSEVNLDSVEDYFLANSISRAWEYPPNATCYISDYQRVMETIREKIYRRLNQELPYTVEQKNVDWFETEDGTIRVENILYVNSESHKKILIGAGGRTLKYIANEAEESLQDTFQKKFKLVLCASVRNKSNPQLVATSEFENLLGYRLTPHRTMAEMIKE